MIRKFSLTNAKGDLIDLLNGSDFFGYNPEGLGIEFDNEISQIGVHSVLSSSKVTAGAFSINLVIGKSGNPYQKFAELVTFLNKEPLTLIYETDAGEWLRDIKLSNLTKSEMQGNYLLETITFDYLSPFYKEIAESIEIQPEQLNDGKIYIETPIKIVAQPEHHHEYDYDYDFVYGVPVKKQDEVIHAYTYDYVYEDYHNGSDGVFTIKNDSKYLSDGTCSPIEIVIHGPCVNPYWQVKQGSKIVQEDGFNLTVPDGAKLVVSSIPHEQRAVIVDADGTESNVYQQQDLSKSNFVTIPTGTSQLMFFECEKVAFRYREESVVV